MNYGYVIKVIWDDKGRHSYVSKRSPNKKPYASSLKDPDIKIWKTKRPVEEWILIRKQTAPGMKFLIVPINVDKMSTTLTPDEDE